MKIKLLAVIFILCISLVPVYATSSMPPINIIDIKIPNPLLSPSAPTDLEAKEMTSSEIRLTWSDNATDETNYIVERKSGLSGYVPIITLPTNSIYFFDENLSRSIKYEYRIKVTSKNGYSYSNVASATIPEEPSPADIFGARPVQFTNNIEVVWFNKSKDAYEVRLARREKGGQFTNPDGPMVVLPATATSYIDENLKPETQYEYWLVVANSINEVTSKPNIYTVTSNPQAPEVLNFTDLSSSKVTINWAKSDVLPDGYYLERKEGNDGGYVKVATTGCSVTSYTDTGLKPDTTYRYRVSVFRVINFSTYSGEVVIHTLKANSIIPSNIKMQLKANSKLLSINEAQSSMDAEPIYFEGRLLVPIRPIVEPIGARVGWNNTNKKATITLNDTTIELFIGSNKAKVNGVEKQIDPDNPNIVPLTDPSGRTMLPLRFIAENLACQVEWDKKTGVVSITKKLPQEK